MTGPYSFSLKSLLGVVTFTAAALASLLHPWRSWCPALVLTALLLLMLAAIPAGIYSRGRERAFYAGFAIVGWGYFLLAYAPWLETNVGRLLAARHVAESACIAVTGSLGDIGHFLTVSHALFMFVAAWGGGLTASWRYDKRAAPAPAENGHFGAVGESRTASSASLRQRILRRTQ